jgi:hypothetical protein
VAPASRKIASERLHLVGHVLTAFVLAVKGFSKLDHAKEYAPLIAVCWGGAALILATLAFRRRLRLFASKLEALILLVEGVVAAIVGTLSMQHGQRYQPYAWFAAAAGLGVASLVRARSPERSH